MSLALTSHNEDGQWVLEGDHGGSLSTMDMHGAYQMEPLQFSWLQESQGPSRHGGRVATLDDAHSES